MHSVVIATFDDQNLILDQQLNFNIKDIEVKLLQSYNLTYWACIGYNLLADRPGRLVEYTFLLFPRKKIRNNFFIFY